LGSAHVKYDVSMTRTLEHRNDYCVKSPPHMPKN